MSLTNSAYLDRFAQARIDDVERGLFLRHHEHVMPLEHGIDDQAGDGLRFARARGP